MANAILVGVEPASQTLDPAWVDRARYPFASRFLRIGTSQVHYIDEGQGPTLLFLTGGPVWSFFWRHHVAALRGRFRCVALDFPGYGPSRAGAGLDNTIAGMSSLAQQFVERLDLQDATLWLHDIGGPVGLGLAARAPERVRGLVLGGTFAGSLEGYPSVERMLRLFTSPPFRWVNRRANILPKLMGTRAALGTRRLAPEEVAQYARPWQDPATRDAPLRLMRSFAEQRDFTRGTRAQLGALRDRPVLLVFGADDPARKAGAVEELERVFPRHTTVLLPHVRHFGFEDAPEATLRAFEDWWPTT